ncbi:LysR family transcriptional regulator [Pseudomonas sp. 5P_3.1_Bac2]|uniref:LysR family transcriptional regulator n=1 Tax=Pseudomonas sp. 5P_3.1_Bac2 TaxID=2971617 RepID=UPI0021C8EEB6|nr:LysR family transcriptional regulator [Pseudomonas sp. 5P_3.1_Bac2]MCU1717898.1 LysR family transcriptional regulator [Pseudomonas sp. 5P_3.1_Bac2]
MDVVQAMRVFTRVVDSGSFTSAGHLLDLSTAQVSRLVSDLEASLQARLLQRTTRRLRLTEVGERYLQRCREILASIDEATAEASGAHLSPRGHLRVHAFSGIGTQYVVPMLARYTELYPEVQFDLTLSQQIPNILEDGHDLLLTHSRSLPDSELVAQRLGTLFSVVCASPGYLQRFGVPKVPRDLLEHRCLSLIDPVFGEEWEFEGDSQLHIQSGKRFRVNLSDAMVEAAKQGMGVCVLPNFIAARAMRDGRLVRVLPQWRLQERQLYALYSSRRYLDAKIKAWVELMKEEIPRLLERDAQDLENPDYWASGAL